MSDIAEKVRAFIDEQVLPHERTLVAGGGPAREVLTRLRRKAQESKLWAPALSVELGGLGMSLNDYASVAELEGKSEYGPAALGSDLLLDATMLDRHATSAVRDQFLMPMVSGRARPCFAMTEPGLPGSDPTRLQTKAVTDGDSWVINGGKWFTSRAAEADFATVACRASTGISLIVVPTSSPGFRVVRSLPLLGGSDDQYEIALNDVRVPRCYLLGSEGHGLAIVGERLLLGRTLRCLRWLGQARRTFDLMCARLTTRRVGEGTLADKQLLHRFVFDSYAELTSARALVYAAVEALATGTDARIAVGIAKVVTARTFDTLVDRAIQIFGAEGLTDDTPLPMLHRTARAARIMDGPDELLVTRVARRILADHQGSVATDPVATARTQPAK
ncbi:acyl-CoA dehydrogenase [Rhizocola hellebori]|uniref:Acyl-CoA dehydrogenase n=2 Tax=Rhizocola hellebori TaxID=1392758 RepID=A0A8J3VEN5_9ACTN|nr:acyl-CoA dehydrogenase [Rhizocola hellebori]